MRTLIRDLKDNINSEVEVKGWVDVRRDQGKLIFLDIRDFSGKVQAVVLPNYEEAKLVAEKLRPEWVIEVKAKVNERPERNKKEGVLNGELELEVLNIKVLNEAETPAFDISTDGKEINEEIRLEKKYLDMRRARIQENLRLRSKVQNFLRKEFLARDFVEVETPILTNPTPEGARSYVVPSRLWKGSFYALPQSPQQYKQLLMSGGMERYFQFAKCMRDEDTRGDRQPEFTQLDIEMSFATAEEVRQVNEEILIKMVKELFPEKRIQQIPFPVLTYAEAMEKYGSDRPDLREDKDDPNLLAFEWVVDFPFFEKTSNSDDPEAEGEWTFTHNPFSRPKEEHMQDLHDKKNIGEIITQQYDIIMNGYELGGGSIRNHKAEDLEKVLEILGYSEERIESNFGHMLRAFRSGTPPHGGIAWGFDRLIMILMNEPNIREVIAFPKTGEGKDLLIQTPAPTSEKHLKELSIKLEK
ncbi:Aspartate--tRNA(Asp) ligase [bioreactor metagenome]|uniref:Aspartate--tRNA(Asp) ligase n=1 Tax=bioreactor metagenome TaxID=1076179 RepID=A0A644T5X4_9ZZZZ|nr:amino acid--tRNA ligase-related protein [Candidatus Elulimicrobiales bacterium]